MYKPLPLKYRPKTLDEVVGQEVVVNLIRSAIKAGKISAPVVLTGIRGTGKTSLARIIAKAINCEDQDNPPCCSCAACLSIESNSTFDVMEIDAASNTGVDDIRSIIESCQYKPTSLKYKVFIVDEVHMLSKSAFNALLKTLEEPPAHVRFLFATTEIDKVPDTVLSRCLRLDLRRVECSEIAQYLSRIAKIEGVDIEPRAVQLIASASGGSVRDALSILNQVFYLDPPIKASSVSDLLGVVDNNVLIKLLQLIISGDACGAINEGRAIYSKISSVKAILNGILEILHHATCKKLGVVNISDHFTSEENEVLIDNIFGKMTIPSINQIWQVVVKGIDEISKSVSEALSLEITIVRACYIAPLPDLYSMVSSVGASSNTNNKVELKAETISSIEDVVRLVSSDAVMSSCLKQYAVFNGVSGKEVRLMYKSNFTEKLRDKLSQIVSQVGYTVVWESDKDASEAYHDDPLLAEALQIFPDAQVTD